MLQYTEEKLGQAERTEMEPEYQALEKKADLTKSYTEKIKNNTAAVIVPNPGKENMWYSLKSTQSCSCAGRDPLLRQRSGEQARTEERAAGQPGVSRARHDRGRQR